MRFGGGMLVESLLAAGCGGSKGDGVVHDGPGSPAGSTGGTGLPDATTATGDTAAPVVVPPPLWPDDCDPHVRVPVLGGVYDPLVAPDAHAEVYGETPTPFAVRYS